MKKLSIALLASLIVVTGLVAQKTPVMGTVDFQRLLNGYDEYQTALEKVQGSIAPAEEELTKAQAELKEMQTQGKELEAKKENPALSEEARAEAEAEYKTLLAQFQKKGQEFQAFQNQVQQRRNQSRQQNLLPLELTAREAIATVAKDKGVDLVLEIAPIDVKKDETKTFNVFRGVALYADDSLEITDSVIALLNASAE